MSQELPQGWVKTILGEITQPSRERALPDEVPGMRYVGLEHIEPQTMKLLGHGYAQDTRSSSVRFLKGDVLYGKMRPYLNKVWVAEFDGICSAEFLVFPKYDSLNSSFLAMRLNAEDFVTFANSLVSGERPRVDFAKLSGFPILLPPNSEQERIVAKLYAALSGLDRAEAATKRAQERLERYRSAVIDAAVTGKLTREWREAKNKKSNIETAEALLLRLVAARRARWEEDEIRRLRIAQKEPKNDKWKTRYKQPLLPDTGRYPDMPSDWAWATFDQISSLITKGSSPAWQGFHYSTEGIVFVRSENVRVGFLDLSDVAHLPPAFNEKERKSILEEGDLLLNIVGASIGRAAIATLDVQGGNVNQAVAVIRLVQKEIMNRFAMLWLNSSLAQARIHSKKVDFARANFSLENARSLTVPIPSFEEQAEIVRIVEHRLSAAHRLATTLEQQRSQSYTTRQELLHEAFAGNVVPQNSNEEPASALLERIRIEKAGKDADRNRFRHRLGSSKKKRSDFMQEQTAFPKTLTVAWDKIGRKTDARRLFDEAGFGLNDVAQFYEALRATLEVRVAFQEAAQRYIQPQKRTKPAKERHTMRKGSFRITELWLEDFKNLRDYRVQFDPTYALDVVLGWNGTGKSNLFEALVIIFRDLHEWLEKNRWPDKPMNGYRLRYEIDKHTVEVTWQPETMRRPEFRRGPISKKVNNRIKLELIKREELQLPRFVFGYYSGPTNRLAEHFLPMKQAHYIRLREAKADDAQTLATLLEQRRFFCAETHHAKYVLLAFSYKEDSKISEFLKDRLRILGFESALFIIRKPRWARPGSKAEDFWGATGIMRRVMERLRRYAIAPMVLEQIVNYGYRSATEDHYYFFLPDIQSLHSFAAEYHDARSFFLALESTDFSELIHDVKIQVRIKATNAEQISITFHQLSEGEQQLLMVLGLLRFTKSHQSLVLLDEPDTHLNPHWSVDYIKDLKRVMSDNALESPEQQSSQILMATHDPLVIASLVKEQIHLLKRDVESLRCYWEQPTEDPRGLGFTGILTSDMFGFRSDLDSETMELLDKQVALAGKEKLNPEETRTLESITQQVENLGFKSASSDPYYRAFIKAIASRQRVRNLLLKQVLTKSDLETLQRETNEILGEIEAEEAKAR
jgi:restriction endonuclease S subunit/predicted ATPase